jgi:hypothetical protein
VILFCADIFGEIYRDYKILLKKLAREAVAGGDSMRLSSFVSLDRKGGSFQIMLQQLRRAVGVAIVSGNAKHKLRCLHYVQESAEEAANASTAYRIGNKWNRRHNWHTGWYDAHTPNGYEKCLQFWNGFFFGML